MTKMIFGVITTLLAITLNSCGKSDLPEVGSHNDYEYTFEVTATNGDAHLLFTPTTDGSTPLLNGEASDEELNRFPTNTLQGTTKVYRITSKGARKFSVKVRVMPSSASGTWTFTGKRNGKVIRNDVHSFQGGNDEESKTYTSSSL